MKFEKPDKIKRAILSKNKEFLSAAGKKGARVVADNREIAKIMTERTQELAAQEEAKLRESTNEHILSVDGENPDENTAD